MKHAYICDDVLMNFDWKIHKGDRALLRYGRDRSDGVGFTVTSGPEFHGR
jgi:hypothetical protein